ncbi:MAG: hypothetical protein M1281_20150 [Chloroflexi bacterium]|nr:hypothetical protein [Chloroflexota bacterium]
MSQTFKCPGCGAPLDYSSGDATTVRCPFCNNVVVVPEELRTKQPVQPAASSPAQSPADPPASLPGDPLLVRQMIRENRRNARVERWALRRELRSLRRR